MSVMRRMHNQKESELRFFHRQVRKLKDHANTRGIHLFKNTDEVDDSLKNKLICILHIDEYYNGEFWNNCDRSQESYYIIYNNDEYESLVEILFAII